MLRLSLLALALAAAPAALAPAALAQTRANDAPRPSPNAGVMQTIGTTEVTVTYGRPSVRGRATFAADSTALAPFGRVWRLGANEATTLTTTAPLRVEGQPLPAGTYAVFAIPGADAWTIIFSTAAEQWGAYRYDPATDALRVTVAPEALGAAQEQFEIDFDGVAPTAATMRLRWDRVQVPVRLQTAE